MNRSTVVQIMAVFTLYGLCVADVAAQMDQPPIFNDRDGAPPYCTYAAQGPICGTECRCSPTVQSVGWPCDGCSVPTGWWPLFSSLYYPHKGACTYVDFHELPLLDLPSGLQAGDTWLASNYSVSLSPIARLGRIREVPLDCSPERAPVDAAARYKLDLGGWGSGADCDGAVFFVTAEYNPTLFDVTLYGRIRSGSSYSCGSTTIAPYGPRLIVGSEVFTTNTLRYGNLISSPDYVKVAIKPGRSPRDVGNQSVKLRVHSFNWGGDHDFFCEALGNCPEGLIFQQNGAAHVHVFSLELPPNWCRDAAPLRPEDALPISTLSDAQRQAAELDGIGAKAINDLTAELPILKVGHNRFHAGRTLEESLGNDAFWYSGFSCNDFVAIDLFGVWCAVEDLPNWDWEINGTVLTVHDPCEGLDYIYEEAPGGPTSDGTPYKLTEVTRSAATVRTYNYSAGGVSGNLVSQVDSNSNQITYEHTPQGGDTLLTVTGTAAIGGTRVITALFSPDPEYLLKSATWANGGPMREYEFIIDPNPAIDGKIREVGDATGNVLLHFDYDDQGRLVETNRGTGPTFQVLSRQTYIDTAGSGDPLADTSMVSQCFVDDIAYQTIVYTFDKYNRIIEKEEFHDLQDVPVTSAEVPAFTGDSSVTTTLNRENEDLDVPNGYYTIERILPSGTVAEYTVFDSNFNTIRTFMAVPGLTTVTGATLINEKRFEHGQYAGVWQTTREIDVARDNATTSMTYDATTGFITGRTMPSISAANSGSGVAIPAQTQTFTYDPVNKKLITDETRNDGQDGTVNITNAHDDYDYPASRTETGTCDTHVTLTEHNVSGKLIRQSGVDGCVTVNAYDEPGHPNDGSGLLLNQYAFESGDSGPVLRQTRYSYYMTGANQGRLERVERADHEGSFTLNNPDGWQVTSFDYDVYGRVATKTTTHTAKPGTFVWTYAYDVQDRVAQLAYPEGTWIRTTRDGRGLVTGEFVGFGGDLSQGAGGTIALTNTYDCDANGNLVNRVNQSAAGLPDHTEYVFDIYNRRTQKTDCDDGSVGYDIITHWEYNGDLDIVREYTEEGSGGPLRLDIRYDIDELGRIWNKTIGEDPTAGLDPARDRITTTTYDIRGSEVETRITDTIVGDAITVRVFTCFDHLDLETLTLTGADEAATDYTTDKRGNKTIVVDPVGNRAEHDYDCLSRPIETRNFEKVANADVLRLTTTTVWTSRDQQARETRFDADETALDQERWAYDILNFETQRARMADPTSEAAVDVAGDRVIDMTYDGVGRLLTTIEYANTIERTTTRVYDDIGRLMEITYPAAGNTESLTYWSNSTRVQTRMMTDEIGSRDITTVFDPFGHLSSETAEAVPPADAVTTTFEYDAAGRRTKVIDPSGLEELHTYDGIGQRTSVTEDLGGANERTVAFEFTQKGDLSKVTADDGEGPQHTQYEHDRAGRRTRVTHPCDGAFAQYAYDAAGRMTERTAEDGYITFFKHNWRGDVVEKRETNDVGPILESFSYDSLGRRTAAAIGEPASSQYKTTSLYGDGTDVDSNGVNDPAYRDMPVSVTQVVGGVAKTITHAYDTAGEREMLDYPEDCNTTLSFGYEGTCGCASGQVTSIDRNGVRMANYEYAGQHVKGRQVRTTAAPGETWIEIEWDRPDQLRRPSTITNRVRTGSSGGVGGTTTDLIVFDNLFDVADNLDTQTVSGSPVENGLIDHTYDRLHRLTQSYYPDVTSEVWQLDELSNWEQYTARDTSVTTYEDNSCSQYTQIDTGPGPQAVMHDAKGNLIHNERGYGFSYDFESRLTRVFTDDTPANGVYDPGEPVHAEYVVDALGRRVQATIAAPASPPVVTRRYYDTNDVILAEYDAAGPASPLQLYINGPTYLDEKVLMQNALGQEYYYLLGHLYTVAGLVGGDGDFLEVYTYTAYGLPTITTFGDTPCTRGDVNGDDLVDGHDVQFFVNVALGHDTEPAHVCAADIDGDNDVDADDATLLVACLLSGSCASVCSPGDLNADGEVDEADAALLVQVLLAATSDPSALCAADMNADGMYDSRDIQGFVNCAIYGDCPSPDSQPQAVNNPFFFTGQRLDTLDGGNLLLYDYKARAYDPLHGRFQQRDSAEFADSYNLYEYVTSRPTVLTDPTGSEFCLIGIMGVQGIRSGLQSIRLPGLAAALLLAKKVAFVASAFGAAVIIREVMNEGPCDFYYAWCMWANRRPPGDQGKGWKRNAPCGQC